MTSRNVLAALAVLGVGAAPAAERVVTPGETVAVTVNGVPARIAIDPEAPGLPMVTQSLAQRAGLSCSGLICFGVVMLIGRERIPGKTAVTPFGWDGGPPDKRRVGWLERDLPLPADGEIGPGGLSEPVVHFALRAPRAGERTVALPMAGSGGLSGSWGSLRARLMAGGEEISVRFDLHGRRSLATAGAAVAIARAQGGVLTEERDRQVILWGVERPIRIMRLARPLPVGPLALPTLGVRVTDGAGANTIPEADADPSEVVVNAKGKKSPRILSIGRDLLDRCSALVFDKPAKEVRMTCA